MGRPGSRRWECDLEFGSFPRRLHHDFARAAASFLPLAISPPPCRRSCRIFPRTGSRPAGGERTAGARRGNLNDPIRSCRGAASGRRAGRSIAVSGVKGRPKEAYFGAVGGGLWKTTDGGENWAPVTDGQIASSSVGAVAVSESNPDIVYIGMGESCIRGNIMPGDGVYKSTDAGKTWTHVGFGAIGASRRSASIPRNPDVVFVASFGKHGVPNDERGVFKTTDGGKTWRKTLFRDDKTGAVDISIDRRNPERGLRRALGGVPRRVPDVERRPGQRAVQVDRRRRDLDRDHAQPRPAGRRGRPDRRRVSGADSNRVYALVENENGGLFVSDDAGATWKLVNDNRNIRQRAFYYTHVTPIRRTATPSTRSTSARSDRPTAARR